MYIIQKFISQNLKKNFVLFNAYYILNYFNAQLFSSQLKKIVKIIEKILFFLKCMRKCPFILKYSPISIQFFFKYKDLIFFFCLCMCIKIYLQLNFRILIFLWKIFEKKFTMRYVNVKQV